MKTVRRIANCITIGIIAALCLLGMVVSADSGDNSLYDLGLENASSCSPEFYYSTLEYDVTVPAGTKELTLSPVTSNSNATITDISGTQLDENGQATVYITVEAPNGARVSYTLHVTSEGEPQPAETEPVTEKSQEEAAQEESQKQSESEAAARKEAELAQTKQQMETLSKANEDLTGRMNLLLKVMYGLVGFAVLLLFFMINQSLRNKDLKDDLKEARAQAEQSNEFARKEQGMQQTYFYNPPQNPIPPNIVPNMESARVIETPPVAEASVSVHEAFGNASQVLQAQPLPGQVNAPVKQAKEEARGGRRKVQPQETVPQPEIPVPAEPTLVKGAAAEPDVNVEMIDL